MDNDAVRELLKTCPTTEIKGGKERPPAFEDQLPDSKDGALHSKV